MTRAYVLVNVETGKAEEVRGALRGRPGIHSADIVIGPHDVIASIEAADLNEIAALVLNEIHGIPGVRNTLTYPIVETAPGR